jgi:hypothetical protein
MSEGHTAATKRVALLQRQGNMELDAFFSYWGGPHAELASTLPGLSRYTQNRMIEPLWAVSTDAPAFSFDGVAELEFEKTTAASTSSDATQKALVVDEAKFIGAITLCRVNLGGRHTWSQKQKVWVAGVLSTDKSVLDIFVSAIRCTACTDFSVEQVKSTFRRDTLGFESRPPTAFATLWFDSDVNVTDQFKSDRWRDVADSCLTRGAAWLVEVVQVLPTAR